MSVSSRLVVVILGASGCLLCLAGAAPKRTPRLLFNTTASAPLGFYLVSPGEVAKGDLAVVTPPRDLALWLAARHYLPANVPLLKEVAAVGGQHVCSLRGEIRIDGAPVAQARRHDRWGRSLPVYTGCRPLQSDEVFLLNRRAPQSLDGRYFGPMAARQIVGRAHPIWTWGSGQ